MSLCVPVSVPLLFSLNLILLAVASSSHNARTAHNFSIREASVRDLHLAFNQNKLTSRQLVEFYLREIQRLNPLLHGVIEVNPDALLQADTADHERKAKAPGSLPGLHGIPILLKDNIATKDKLNTMAGSFALLGSVVARDAGVVTKLRKAGAIILGKASLSEWANFRTSNAPNGWSARGGQSKNPYNLSADPCGSSSGSAISVAANMVAVSLGSETDGSIICPAGSNSVVGIKPTVGLTSRAGVIPISPRQDTIGPICRTVSDAVYVLDAIAGFDHNDAQATKEASKYIPVGGYKKFLKADGFKGKRLGIVRNPSISRSSNADIFEDHLATLRQGGAILIDHLEITNIDSILDFTSSGEEAAMLAEFKLSLNAYLKELVASPVRSLADVIAFNQKFSNLESCGDLHEQATNREEGGSVHQQEEENEAEVNFGPGKGGPDGDDEQFDFSDDEDRDWAPDISGLHTDEEGDESSDFDLSDFESEEEEDLDDLCDEEGGSVAIGKMGRGRKRMTQIPYKESADGVVRVCVGNTFDSIDHFRSVMQEYVVQNRFAVIKKKNERTRVTWICSGEGCTWRVHASPYPLKKDMTFMIKSFTPNHNCLLNMEKSNAANAKFYATKLLPKLRLNPSMTYEAFLATFAQEYGLHPTYMQYWRARSKCMETIEGKHAESYKKLRVYGQIVLQNNPGSLVKFSVDQQGENIHFKRIFISFAGVIKGLLEGSRPFFGLDGCFLKGECKGQLLAAVSLDGNNGVYPIAIAIVEAECNESWDWFMEHLHCLIGNTKNGAPWTIMSDRQKGLVNAVGKWFPGSPQRHCCRHIFANMCKEVRGGQLVRKLFWKAAKSTENVEFEMYMAEIKRVRPEAYNYMMKIPLEEWARHAFDRTSKNANIPNNMTETFNAWLGELRSKPILKMVLALHNKMSKRLYKRKEKGQEFGLVTAYIRDKLIRRMGDTKGMQVFPAAPHEFQVKDLEGIRRVVNLNDQYCTCQDWQICGIPCVHACATMMWRHDSPEKYVDGYFSKENYLKQHSGVIHAIADERYWPLDQHAPLLPPLVRRHCGRPRKMRKREDGEATGSRVCKRCKGKGHTSRTCQGGSIGGKSSNTKRKRASVNAEEGSSSRGKHMPVSRDKQMPDSRKKQIPVRGRGRSSSQASHQEINTQQSKAQSKEKQRPQSRGRGRSSSQASHQEINTQQSNAQTKEKQRPQSRGRGRSSQ